MGRSLRGMAERSGREDNSIVCCCVNSLLSNLCRLNFEPELDVHVCTSRLADSLTQS